MASRPNLLPALILLLILGCAQTPGRGPAPKPGDPEPEPRPGKEVREEEEEAPLPSDPLARAMESARRALRAGRHADAEAAAREAIRLAPGDVQAWNLGAVVAFDRKDLGTCEERLDRALALAPDSRDAILNRGLVRFARKDYSAAAADFGRILSLPVPPGRIVDVEVARREYEERLRRGEIEVTFPEAVNRELLPVDRAVMYAKWYGRLAAILVRGPPFPTAYHAETKSYRVVTDDSELAARALASDLELALVEYRRLFPRPAASRREERFEATLFKGREEYVRYLGDILKDPNTAGMSGGAYHSLFRELYLHRGPTWEATLLVAYHEGFHQYVDSFLPDLPPWVNEGLADYFGASHAVTGRLVPGDVHPLRIVALRRALAGGKAPDLRGLVLASHAEFLAAGLGDSRARSRRVGRNYALAWAFCHFLVEGDGGRHRALLDRYLARLAAGATPAEACGEVLDPAFDDGLENAFLEHARTRLLGPAD